MLVFHCPQAVAGVILAMGRKLKANKSKGATSKKGSKEVKKGRTLKWDPSTNNYPSCVFIDDLEKFNLEKEKCLQNGDCLFSDKELSELRTKRKNADHARISKLRRKKKTDDLLAMEAYLEKEYKKSEDYLQQMRAEVAATKKRINYYECQLNHYRDISSYTLPIFLVFRKK